MWKSRLVKCKLLMPLILIGGIKISYLQLDYWEQYSWYWLQQTTDHLTDEWKRSACLPYNILAKFLKTIKLQNPKVFFMEVICTPKLAFGAKHTPMHYTLNLYYKWFVSVMSVRFASAAIFVCLYVMWLLIWGLWNSKRVADFPVGNSKNQKRKCLSLITRK